MREIDQATIDIVDAIEHISKAMTHEHRWSRKERNKLKQAIGLCMQVTGELDNIEIGPPAANTWSSLTKVEL